MYGMETREKIQITSVVLAMIGGVILIPLGGVWQIPALFVLGALLLAYFVIGFIYLMIWQD